MATTIPDLWSSDIQVDVLTPVAILRMQVSYFDKKTQGILQAGVSTTSTDDRHLHGLDLIAPLLDHYRKTLLTAEHRRDEAYPVVITSQALVPEDKRSGKKPYFDEIEVPGGVGQVDPSRREANTQEEFIELVRQVLQSGTVRSLIQSLIARSNEVRERSSQKPLESVGNGDAEGEVHAT